jgi:hypothetical protein
MATLFSAAPVSIRPLAVQHVPTVYGQVAQCRTRRTLHLDVGILEEKQDGLQGIAIDLSDIWRGIR